MPVPAQGAKTKSHSREWPVENASSGVGVKVIQIGASTAEFQNRLTRAMKEVASTLNGMMKSLKKLYGSLTPVQKRKWRGADKYYLRYRRIGERRARRARQGGKRP